jgi:hypothetical protein
MVSERVRFPSATYQTVPYGSTRAGGGGSLPPLTRKRDGEPGLTGTAPLTTNGHQLLNPMHGGHLRDADVSVSASELLVRK